MPEHRLRLRRTIGLVLCLLVCACGGSETSTGGSSTNPGASQDPITLVLAAYTTPREAYRKAVIPAFQKMWKETRGQEVEFRESYQGSGTQSRAVVGGFEADVVALSLEADVDRIAQAGLIRGDWREKARNGMVSRSVVVLAVRPGNPKGIKDWADLTREGISILTPDPKTSGGAMWNINAVYGAALRGFAGGSKDDPAAASAFLAQVFRNVTSMDKGARESITMFEKGVGDVAVTYENEVLVGRKQGQSYDYVIPRSTILIENPIAVVDANADKHGVREAADAFVAFTTSPEAQRAFAEYGLRSVDEAVATETSAQFPPVEDLWKVDYLGGWPKVTETLYGPAGVFTKIMESDGDR